MSTLEKKIDIILEWIADDMSNNPIIRQKAKEALGMTNAETSYDLNADDVIRDLFKDLGVVPSLRGYDYAFTAVKLVLDDPSRINDICKRIYADIASEYGSTSSRVERAIRTLTDRALDYGGENIVREILGNVVSSKTGNVGNGTFIAACVQEVKRRMKQLGY